MAPPTLSARGGGFEGRVEGVAGTLLYGWCRLTGMPDPVTLELLAVDRPVATVRADLFRQVLLDAGYGAGRHGFRLDLATLGLGPKAALRVRVAVHEVELENSGRCRGDFAAES